MCGILCCIIRSSDQKSIDDIISRLQSLQDDLERRGPDSHNAILCPLGENLWLFMYSTVLWLQGSHVCSQPLKDEKENLLQWNGDIYYANAGDKSDTQLLLERLSESQSDEYPDIFGAIQGPWTFTFWNSLNQELWFGRDFFGRRSLLLHYFYKEDLYKPDIFLLSSVALHLDLDGFRKLQMEVPAKGIFCLRTLSWQLHLHPWEGLELSKSDIEELSFRVEEKCIPQHIKNDLNRDIPMPERLPTIHPSDVVFSQLLADPLFISAVENLETLLKMAVSVRARTHPGVCKNCLELQECTHTKVAILFSGGVDSGVLASLCHEFVGDNETIDLINVAFHQKNSDEANAVPDRITGLSCFQELEKIHPGRWNFVKVDVDKERLVDKRKSHVRHLIYPCNTVLDDGIGCALWFAGLGEGVLLNGESYKSPARVLMVGMGADEQLCGYSRHRERFKSDGWLGAIQEIENQVTGMWKRNMGRDDRILSDHGRQARFPYLDSRVVSFLHSLPVWVKADFRQPRGIGEKMILRLLAHRLGLHSTARLPKRAIQFGSRIAKLEDRKEKGSDACPRL